MEEAVSDVKQTSVNGETIEWWQVTVTSLPSVSMDHCRATYYESTAWNDHPWAQKIGRDGADFVRDWAIEKEGDTTWWPSGRAGRPDFAEWVFSRSDYPCFRTRAEAVAYLLKFATARLARLNEDRLRYEMCVEDLRVEAPPDE